MLYVDVSEKAGEMIKEFLKNRKGLQTIRISRMNACAPGLSLVLDEPGEHDLTLTVGDITFAIDRYLLEKARPIRLDYVVSAGQSGFRLTSSLPTGGCG